MTVQPILAASLICMGRSQRAELMHAMPPASPTGHATGFPTGMHVAVPSDTEDALPKGQLRLLPEYDGSLRCVSGELWLTRDGDTEDYILGPGQTLTLRRGDKAVVHALRDSRFRLSAA